MDIITLKKYAVSTLRADVSQILNVVGYVEEEEGKASHGGQKWLIKAKTSMSMGQRATCKLFD
jgi:hypothetical protein